VHQRLIDPAMVEAEIAHIRSLGIDALRRRWRAVFGRTPPTALTKDLLGRMLAFHMQERAFGGLDRESLRLLDGFARQTSLPRRHLKPGTVLVREDRIMSALDLNIGLMVLLEDLAKEHYDGNFTIMKLGPVWRIGFGTPLDREGMSAWAFGKTFAEAAKRAIAEALIEQRVSAAAVKEVAGTKHSEFAMASGEMSSADYEHFLDMLGGRYGSPHGALPRRHGVPGPAVQRAHRRRGSKPHTPMPCIDLAQTQRLTTERALANRVCRSE
jgi:hypothetical protein